MLKLNGCRRANIGFGLAARLSGFATTASTSDVQAQAEPQEKPASFVDEDGADEQPDPAKFNKSRLLDQHRKLLYEQQPPYEEPHSWIHMTEKYQRKMFGRYGAASGVDPRICFATKYDIAQQAEYERVSFPYTLPEMMEQVRAAQTAKREKIAKREADISKKLEKLEQWKAELNAKVAKREGDALAAKERKERLIEEVRRHFGFKVDPRDERFKEMLEQKEKEDKKKQKEAKRKAKEEQMMAKLLEKSNKKAPSA